MVGTCTLRLVDDVVIGSELSIRSSGTDLHLRAGKLVKKEWRAPAIAELAAGIDGRVILGDQGQLENVCTGEGSGNLSVVTDRIASVGKVRAERFQNIRHDVQVGLDGACQGVEGVREMRYTVDRGHARNVEGNNG